MADKREIPPYALHELLCGYVKAKWPATGDVDAAAQEMAADPVYGGEPELVALVAAAYAAGHKARLTAQEKGEVESAVNRAVNDWTGELCDPARLERLLAARPDAPTLSDDPYQRRLELDAILSAACALAGVQHG